MDLVNPELHLYMTFPDIQTFREAVKEYNLLRGKEIRFKKNERRKSIVVCRDDKCRYRVYAMQVSDEQTFQIRSMQPKHVCGRQYKNSIVNSTWISNKLIEKFRIQLNMLLNVIQHEVKEKWKVDVSPSMMYRARAKACQKIFRKLQDQYGHLWDYCKTLRQTNRGSCMMMKVDRPNPNVLPKFGRLYFSLAAMKKGFLDGWRPVIEVDGCFLKGPFKGQLLAAVGRDGNNNMYPIAFAVVEAETKDSWTWFLETLVSDLGVHEGAGLMLALESVLPTADHRICVRHLYANFRDLEGHKGLALKEQLWAAATAYTEHEFTTHMEELKKLSKDAYDYLNKLDPSGWSRAWFNEAPRCELLVNNICECFNSYILKARDKPILTMLEMIRKKLLRRYQAKREGIAKLTGRLCPRIVQKLEAIGLDAMDCIATYAGDGMFEAMGNHWNPCPHAFAAVLYDCGNSEDYVDECYTIETYKKAYAPIIYPMPSEEQWIKTRHDHLEPPTIRVAPERPKRLRKRAPNESRDPKNPNRIRKFGARMRCAKCTGLGHNKRSCPLNQSSGNQLNTPPTASSQSVGSNTRSTGKSKARVVGKKAKAVKSSGSGGPSQSSNAVKNKEDLKKNNTASGSTAGPQASTILKKGKGKGQPTHAPRGFVIPRLVDEREHTPPPGFGAERGATLPPVENQNDDLAPFEPGVGIALPAS
ncbi:uncharacterized protein LOC132167790 [Corylus avellana]|uniref:uncharacterized protein LOC132167790 n=1 Tax=Corylus avellana TaxID=13451 RepID=UPI00286ABF43|nr:uncharacterized protein LOC132167790 [Corylus avellana]